MWTCDAVDSLNENGPLWDEWQALLPRVAPGMRLFSPQWYAAWQQTWGGHGRWTGELVILTVRDGARRLQGIAVIARPRVGPLKLHAFGGFDQPFRPILAAAGHETAVGRAIGEFVTASDWKLVQLGPILRSFAAHAALLECLRERGVFLQTTRSAPQAICHTPASWDEYCQVLGGKFLRNVNYYERRTARAGAMRIEHYRQPSSADTTRLLEALATIENRSWMATRKNAHPRFINPLGRRMWATLIERTLAPRDQIDCWVMWLADTPVSFCLTLSDAPVRYVIANNYDQAVEDHRTGSTLYKYMMRDGIERGMRHFDFGDGEIHYKRHWGAEYRDTCDTLFAWPHRLLGRAAHTASVVRDKLAEIRP